MIKYYVVYPFFIVLFLMFSFKVFAENVDKKETLYTETQNETWGDFCSSYENVSYQEGIDVRGKPVVKADIAEASITIPETIEFDLDINSAKYLGLITDNALMANAKIGRIKVVNNNVYFNDKLITKDNLANFDRLCHNLSKENTRIENKTINLKQGEKKNETESNIPEND